MPDWLILVYKLPPGPSRVRVGVWRRLKAAGAVYLQDSVAALPQDAAAERVMRGLAAEIGEARGTAYLLRGGPLGDGGPLLAAFNAARVAEYVELLARCRDFHAELATERAAANFTFAELEENEEDLRKLEAWHAKICARDRFAVPERQEAERALAACRDDLETFAADVYATADHGSARGGGDGDGDGGGVGDGGTAAPPTGASE